MYWNKLQSATHGFGIQVHHVDTWNHEHQNAWNGNCACAQMNLVGTNAALGVFGCHTSAHQDLRGAMCVCEIFLGAIYEYAVCDHMMIGQYATWQHGDGQDDAQ